MRIFDNVLLAQYLDAGAKVKVYANSEWYTLADKSDVADKVDAVGYDEYQGAHYFSYQTIEQIQVNGQIITLEMLSAKMGDKVAGDKKEKPTGGEEEEEEAPEETPPPEEEKPDKGPDLSWFSPAYDIGRILMKEKDERKKRGSKI